MTEGIGPTKPTEAICPSVTATLTNTVTAQLTITTNAQ
jgi:hypothetical protein